MAFRRNPEPGSGPIFERPRLYAAGLASAALLIAAPLAASADAATPVGLGAADSFALLGGSAISNTGVTVISGDVGLSPGTSVSGFSTATVTAGTIHANDAVAAQAQGDLTTAYGVAAGEPTTNSVSADLAGSTLTSGVYAGGALGLSGALTLNAQGDPNAVFVFKAASSLTVNPGSRVNLINGAQACNVYWQVTSDATIDVGSAFAGNILALTSITMNGGASLDGRALARNGAVTLINNRITRPACTTAAATSTTQTSTTTPTGAPGTTPGANPLPTKRKRVRHRATHHTTRHHRTTRRHRDTIARPPVHRGRPPSGFTG